MDKFNQLTGVAAPLPIINVDTDMIIPKQYLKTIKRTGLGSALFSEMRYNEDGSENAEFVLNKPAYRHAQIIVAGDNFGCGSSREHAPWALLDFGIRCVISTSFADIFYNNCFKNGILPIKVTPEQLKLLMDDAERGSNATISVDLEAQTIKGPDGGTLHFDIDPSRKHTLLEGLDDIAATLKADPAISGFEKQMHDSRPLALNGTTMVKRISTGSPFEATFGYSRAVVDGDRVHVSGTTGYDYAVMKMPESVGEQAANALKTIEKALNQAGAQMADVVRVTYYVGDRSYVDEVVKAVGPVFKDIRPAASMLLVGMIEEAMKIEIEVEARIGASLS